MRSDELPTQVQLEREFLGQLLLNNDLMKEAIGRVSSQAFSTEFHQRLFTAMDYLYSKEGKFDPITLSVCSGSKTADITSLTYQIPHVETVEKFVQLLERNDPNNNWPDTIGD